jgi:propionyl-CoA synthetase
LLLPLLRHCSCGALFLPSPQDETLTYRQLLGRVKHFAGALADHGVGKGDRVVIYMPMVPEVIHG